MATELRNPTDFSWSLYFGYSLPLFRLFSHYLFCIRAHWKGETLVYTVVRFKTFLKCFEKFCSLLKIILKIWAHHLYLHIRKRLIWCLSTSEEVGIQQGIHVVFCLPQAYMWWASFSVGQFLGFKIYKVRQGILFGYSFSLLLSTFLLYILFSFQTNVLEVETQPIAGPFPGLLLRLSVTSLPKLRNDGCFEGRRRSQTQFPPTRDSHYCTAACNWFSAGAPVVAVDVCFEEKGEDRSDCFHRP
jgi:hypothetical protein